MLPANSGIPLFVVSNKGANQVAMSVEDVANEKTVANSDQSSLMLISAYGKLARDGPLSFL